MRRRFTRAQVREIDRRWHEFQLACNGVEHERLHENAVYNFAVLDRMPPRVRALIDQLGPFAPDWANEWFATGEAPADARTGAH